MSSPYLVGMLINKPLKLELSGLPKEDEMLFSYVLFFILREAYIAKNETQAPKEFGLYQRKEKLVGMALCSLEVGNVGTVEQTMEFVSAHS